MALVCPVQFVGVIDGVYWYVGERCADHSYRYLTSASPLTITPCPGNAQACYDDGTGFAATSLPEMVFFKTAADEGAVDYFDPNAVFPEIPGSVDQLDQNDCSFLDEQGMNRLCRIFLVRVRHRAVTLYLRVGFELKPGSLSTSNVLEKVQKLGNKTYKAEFGLVPFFVFLRR